MQKFNSNALANVKVYVGIYVWMYTTYCVNRRVFSNTAKVTFYNYSGDIKSVLKKKKVPMENKFVFF